MPLDPRPRALGEDIDPGSLESYHDIEQAEPATNIDTDPAEPKEDTDETK